MVPTKNISTLKIFKQSMWVLTCMLFYILFWVFSTPVASVLLRKVPLGLRISFQTITLVIIFRLSGFLNFWIALIPLFCVESSIFVRSKRELKENTVNQLLLLSCLIIFHLSIYVLFEVFFKESIDLQIRSWFERIDLYWDSMLQNFGTESDSRKVLVQGWLGFLDYLPSIYFGGFIVGFYGCFLRTSTLSKFKCPSLIFWLAIFSFALGYIDWSLAGEFIGIQKQVEVFSTYQILFKNLFIILACIYFFQGLSVSSHLMDTFKIARFWQNLWYILIIFNSPMIIVFMGLLDFIFEFRSFKERK